jgi:Uma2 family endonuclease
MVTYTKPEIDWDTFPTGDGEPVAETIENMVQMVDLMFALRDLLDTQGRVRVAVGGNQLMYYNRQNGRDHVSPDVYVALDVAPGGRPKWETWVEGKFPDIVFEITSPSTQDVDLGKKRSLYARLGAHEYYIYDPQQELSPSFQGYIRRGDALEPMTPRSSGAIDSPLLGAELRQVGIYLRVIDPATGLPIRTADEERHDRRVAEERALLEEQARLAAEDRAARAEAALREALAKLGEERQ